LDGQLEQAKPTGGDKWNTATHILAANPGKPISLRPLTKAALLGAIESQVYRPHATRLFSHAQFGVTGGETYVYANETTNERIRLATYLQEALVTTDEEKRFRNRLAEQRKTNGGPFRNSLLSLMICFADEDAKTLQNMGINVEAKPGGEDFLFNHGETPFTDWPSLQQFGPVWLNDIKGRPEWWLSVPYNTSKYSDAEKQQNITLFEAAVLEVLAIADPQQKGGREAQLKRHQNLLNPPQGDPQCASKYGFWLRGFRFTMDRLTLYEGK
jgi:hypothetical protein